MKTAVITGGGGQDGILMGKLLRREGLRVISVVRKPSPHIPKDPFWLEFPSCVTYTDLAEILLHYYDPDYFINFAAEANPHGSWDDQVKTFEVNLFPVLSQLEAIFKKKPKCRYLNAGSSTQFNGQAVVYREYGDFKFTPDSPYAVSKCSAHEMVKIYAEKGLFAIQPILFNHESIYRKPCFLSKKVSNHVENYLKNKEVKPLEIGNKDSIRDWSHAEDIVEGMWKALNYKTPEQWQLGSAVGMAVSELVKLAFAIIGERGHWDNDEFKTEEGKILAVSKQSLRKEEKISPVADLFEVSRVRTLLEWSPRYGIKEILESMIYGR